MQESKVMVESANKPPICRRHWWTISKWECWSVMVQRCGVVWASLVHFVTSWFCSLVLFTAVLCNWFVGTISKWEMLARNGVLSEVGDPAIATLFILRHHRHSSVSSYIQHHPNIKILFSSSVIHEFFWRHTGQQDMWFKCRPLDRAITQPEKISD